MLVVNARASRASNILLKLEFASTARSKNPTTAVIASPRKLKPIILNSSFTTEVNENAMASTRDTWGGARARQEMCGHTPSRCAVPTCFEFSQRLARGGLPPGLGMSRFQELLFVISTARPHGQGARAGQAPGSGPAEAPGYATWFDCEAGGRCGVCGTNRGSG